MNITTHQSAGTFLCPHCSKTFSDVLAGESNTPISPTSIVLFSPFLLLIGIGILATVQFSTLNAFYLGLIALAAIGGAMYLAFMAGIAAILKDEGSGQATAAIVLVLGVIALIWGIGLMVGGFR